MNKKRGKTTTNQNNQCNDDKCKHAIARLHTAPGKLKFVHQGATTVKKRNNRVCPEVSLQVNGLGVGFDWNRKFYFLHRFEQSYSLCHCDCQTISFCFARFFPVSQLTFYPDMCIQHTYELTSMTHENDKQRFVYKTKTIKYFVNSSHE